MTSGVKYLTVLTGQSLVKFILDRDRAYNMTYRDMFPSSLHTVTDILPNSLHR